MSVDTRSARRSAGHGQKSESIRERAIVGLLSEKTLAAAARRCGVNEKTLRRWLAHDEEFKTEYAVARQAAFHAGISRIQALTGRAVDTLEELLDEKKFPNVRLGAARTVAELAIHQHDAETILNRIDDLERLTRKS